MNMLQRNFAVMSKIYSEYSARNSVRMHWDLIFLSNIVRGLLFSGRSVEFIRPLKRRVCLRRSVPTCHKFTSRCKFLVNISQFRDIATHRQNHGQTPRPPENTLPHCIFLMLRRICPRWDIFYWVRNLFLNTSLSGSIDRIHGLRTIATEVPASDSLFVRAWLRRANTAERIEVLLRVKTTGDPRNIVLDVFPIYLADSIQPSTNYFCRLHLIVLACVCGRRSWCLRHEVALCSLHVLPPRRPIYDVYLFATLSSPRPRYDGAAPRIPTVPQHGRRQRRIMLY